MQWGEGGRPITGVGRSGSGRSGSGRSGSGRSGSGRSGSGRSVWVRISTDHRYERV